MNFQNRQRSQIHINIGEHIDSMAFRCAKDKQHLVSKVGVELRVGKYCNNLTTETNFPMYVYAVITFISKLVI